MIAHLRGRLIARKPNQAIIEAAGVGYEVAVSIPTFSSLPEVGSEVSVHVYTHVREDAISLFAFSQQQEKNLFERLVSVTGIGPKLAITILSGMETEKMVAAIRKSDITALTRIPGVGKKTAERMALELRDKLEGFGQETEPNAAPLPLSEDVISALVNLGYQRTLAERAVDAAVKASGQDMDQGFEATFRRALAGLSK